MDFTPMKNACRGAFDFITKPRIARVFLEEKFPERYTGVVSHLPEVDVEETSSLTSFSLPSNMKRRSREMSVQADINTENNLANGKPLAFSTPIGLRKRKSSGLATNNSSFGGFLIKKSPWAAVIGIIIAMLLLKLNKLDIDLINIESFTAPDISLNIVKYLFESKMEESELNLLNRDYLYIEEIQEKETISDFDRKEVSIPEDDSEKLILDNIENEEILKTVGSDESVEDDQITEEDLEKSILDFSALDDDQISDQDVHLLDTVESNDPTESKSHEAGESDSDGIIEVEFRDETEPKLDEATEHNLDETTEPNLDETTELNLDDTTEPNLDETTAPNLDEATEPNLDEATDSETETVINVEIEDIPISCGDVINRQDLMDLRTEMELENRKLSTEFEQKLSLQEREFTEELLKYKNSLVLQTNRMYETERLTDEALARVKELKNEMNAHNERTDASVANEHLLQMKQLKEFLMDKIAEVEHEIQQLASERSNIVEETMDLVDTDIEHAIRKQLDQHMEKYAADKTGMPDFALESAGAEIIQEFTSRGLVSNSAMVKIWNIPIFYHTMSPRVALQPDVNPGNCFAFGGDVGTLGIKLSRHVVIKNVTVEHIPKEISLTGDIKSAPKQFTIYGMEEETRINLGTFIYDIEGLPTQTFNIQNDSVFKMVQFHFASNWGAQHTCIYRLRVHGKHG